MASFLLYKGTLLLSLLSWAGLFVNGSVAFLLPVVLVVLAHHNLRKYGDSVGNDTKLTAQALDALNKSGKGNYHVDKITLILLS